MTWKHYHNPNLSLPVVRRKLGVELLELLSTFGDVLVTRGYALTENKSLPSHTALKSSLYRLRKAGLVVERTDDGSVPELRLSESGEERLPEALHPRKRWRKKWGGVWYTLVYDVPESERKYRNILRAFLSRLRMGCLQKSVWITPWDIRPEFHDLLQGAAVGPFAYLFESRTVLGLHEDAIVTAAWDMERLNKLQRRYCKVYADNLERLMAGGADEESVCELARQEMSAYLSAMACDPLLPRELYPNGYWGEEVWDLHCEIVKNIRRVL